MPNVLFYFNATPLHFAALSQASEVAVALVASGGDVHVMTRYFLETPLLFALQEGHLDAGANPNAKVKRK
jgi:ankyrin repeat protein